jgi:hypothetical protein
MTEEGISADISPTYAWGIVLSVFLISGLAFTVQAQPANLVSSIIVGMVVASFPWIVLTESGAQWFMNAVNKSGSSSNSQSVSTEPKTDDLIVCSSCGWQNPQNNSYCNDCGDGLAN